MRSKKDSICPSMVSRFPNTILDWLIKRRAALNPVLAMQHPLGLFKKSSIFLYKHMINNDERIIAVLPARSAAMFKRT